MAMSPCISFSSANKQAHSKPTPEHFQQLVFGNFQTAQGQWNAQPVLCLQEYEL